MNDDDERLLLLRVRLVTSAAIHDDDDGAGGILSVCLVEKSFERQPISRCTLFSECVRIPHIHESRLGY